MPKTTVLFVTSYVVSDLKKVGGGIGGHFYGLYYTLTRKHSNSFKVYWYSRHDHKLRGFDEQGNIKSISKKSMLGALLSVSRNIKSKRSLVVCLAYPYGCVGFGYYLFLLFLAILRICKIVSVVTDCIDPPIEINVTFKGQIEFLLYLKSIIKDLFTFKNSDLIIFLSDFYLKRITKRYSISRYKTCIIPHGGFTKVVSPRYPKMKGNFTLLYAGSLIPVKDIPALIRCVERVRGRGYDVILMLSGQRGIQFEEQKHLRYRFEPNWLSWIDNVLMKADAGVIPYPRRIHWDLTHLAKVVDYMCAGKPVISMNLSETARILRTHNCGLIAHDWNEFENMVIKLYKDRKLAAQLGKNGRRAVEEYYDHEKNADQLAELMKTITRGGRIKA